MGVGEHEYTGTRGVDPDHHPLGGDLQDLLGAVPGPTSTTRCEFGVALDRNGAMEIEVSRQHMVERLLLGSRFDSICEVGPGEGIPVLDYPRPAPECGQENAPHTRDVEERWKLL
jgi:hypothetical protein